MEVNYQDNSNLVIKASGKKKNILVVLSILVFLILLGGIAAGTLLVRQNQDIREKAANYGGSDCGQSSSCVKIDNPSDPGSYTVSLSVDYVIIKAGTLPYMFPGDSSNCYLVTIDGYNVSWQKIGPEPECKDISHVEIWLTGGVATTYPLPSLSATASPQIPLVTATPITMQTLVPTAVSSATVQPTILLPTSTSLTGSASVTEEPFFASCGGIFAYDTSWNPLTAEDMSLLKAGNIIRLTFSATTNEGYFDKARFIVNGITYPETTLKKPGTDRFYYDYVIPVGTTYFMVTAEIHHSIYGWSISH